MKTLTWDNSLSVQIPEIDDDHRKLVELFNILNKAVTEEDSPEYIDAVLDELTSLTIWHFKHEERLMLKYNYNGITEHKLEHAELVESVQQLQQKLRQQGTSISVEDIEFLEHWLTGHILGTDMELGSFLGEVM